MVVLLFTSFFVRSPFKTYAQTHNISIALSLQILITTCRQNKTYLPYLVRWFALPKQTNRFHFAIVRNQFNIPCVTVVRRAPAST